MRAKVSTLSEHEGEAIIVKGPAPDLRKRNK